jgi:large subunit ribosomal protein L11
MTVSVVISVYADRSFSYKVKSPPAAVLLKDAAKIAKASGVPNKEKVGSVNRDQLLSIAERKLPDLNCYDVDAAARIVTGTARSMGIDIVD